MIYSSDASADTRKIATKASIASGKTVLQIAADIAVCNFNDGLKSIMQIMQVLHMAIGDNCYKFCVEADCHRINMAERSLTEAAKESRRDSKTGRKEEEEQQVNLEGQQYGAGIAE